jgi:hypothetical protein
MARLLLSVITLSVLVVASFAAVGVDISQPVSAYVFSDRPKRAASTHGVKNVDLVIFYPAFQLFAGPSLLGAAFSKMHHP